MTQLEPCVDQTAESDSSTIKPLEAPNLKSSQGPSEGARGGASELGAVCSCCGKGSENPPNSTPSSPRALSPAPSTHGADDSESDRKNVVFFGETGVGKSSVINMFREGTDHSGAKISSGAVGCTFSSQGYEADVNGKRYMLWDTAGLNEGVRGAVTHRDSVDSLAKLLLDLDGEIHLLVYCIRGKRFRQVVKDNYELFYTRLCGSQVPIVAVVTGLENEEPDMENWWKENHSELLKYGLAFTDHACITATRGKVMKDGRNMLDEEYEDSRQRVRLLIAESCSKTGCPVFDIRDQHPAIQTVDRSSSMIRWPSHSVTTDGGRSYPDASPGIVDRIHALLSIYCMP